MIAAIGEAGEGKSTLLNLILNSPGEDEIFFDGSTEKCCECHNLSDLCHGSLKSIAQGEDECATDVDVSPGNPRLAKCQNSADLSCQHRHMLYVSTDA